MAFADQRIRTFFTTSVTWERRFILQSDRLCTLLLDVMREHRSKNRFQLHEFVFMLNHMHLILTPAPEVSLEKAMQLIKGGFSYRAKKEMALNLEVWQKGFTQHRIKDREDYDRHVEYIWMNPVKAGLVQRPEDFPFSSARLRDAVDPAPPWLKPRSFGVSSSQR